MAFTPVSNMLNYSQPNMIGADQARRKNAWAERGLADQEANSAARRNAMAFDQEQAVKFNQLEFDERKGKLQQTEAMQHYQAARTVLASRSPKATLLQAFPNLATDLSRFGKSAATLTDQEAMEMAQRVAEQFGAFAGIGPKEPESFTLSPGQTRYQGGQAVASAPKPPEQMSPYEQQRIDLERQRIEIDRDKASRPPTQSVPPGYRYLQDGTLEAIPGGPADAKAKSDAKATESRMALDQTWKLYETARDGLVESLEASDTGPLVGRIPAFTSEQQAAEGGVAAMAPVLKQLFRTAGEGTFTDRDQALLLEMVPKRTDRLGARNSKIANIDKIVKAKLGMSAGAPGGASPSEPRRVRSIQEAMALPVGTVFMTPDGQRKVR